MSKIPKFLIFIQAFVGYCVFVAHLIELVYGWGPPVFTKVAFLIMGVVLMLWAALQLKYGHRSNS